MPTIAMAREVVVTADQLAALRPLLATIRKGPIVELVITTDTGRIVYNTSLNEPGCLRITAALASAVGIDVQNDLEARVSHLEDRLEVLGFPG